MIGASISKGFKPQVFRSKHNDFTPLPRSKYGMTLQVWVLRHGTLTTLWIHVGGLKDLPRNSK